MITCCANGEGCLIKGFTIRRLDSNKIDPTSCGVNGAQTSALNTEKSNTNVSERDLRVNEGNNNRSSSRTGDRDRDDNDGGSKGGASSNRIHSAE